MPSIITALDAILPLIPASEPLKAELQAFRDSIFLELPEGNRHLWIRAGKILARHYPQGDELLSDWQRSVVNVWDAVMIPVAVRPSKWFEDRLEEIKEKCDRRYGLCVRACEHIGTPLLEAVERGEMQLVAVPSIVENIKAAREMMKKPTPPEPTTIREPWVPFVDG